MKIIFKQVERQKIMAILDFIGKWFECPVLTKDMSLYYYSLIV